MKVRVQERSPDFGENDNCVSVEPRKFAQKGSLGNFAEDGSGRALRRTNEAALKILPRNAFDEFSNSLRVNEGRIQRQESSSIYGESAALDRSVNSAARRRRASILNRSVEKRLRAFRHSRVSAKKSGYRRTLAN